MKAQLVIAGLAIVMTACGSTLTVHREGVETKGVPFYIHRGCCKQTTAWNQPLYSLTLKKDRVTYKADGKDVTRVQWEKKKTISQSSYNQHYAALKQLVDTGATEVQILANWGGIPTAPLDVDLRSVQAAPPDFVLASNTSEVVTYVDYGTPHTFNVKRPFIGSSTATVKLSDQGTLSEASGTIEEKTAETLLAMVPVKEYLTASFVPDSSGQDGDTAGLQWVAGPVDPAGTTEDRITLSMESSIVSHTLVGYSDVGEKGKCVLGPPLDAAPDEIHYTKQAGAAAGAKESEDDKGSFSGSFALPETSTP